MCIPPQAVLGTVQGEIERYNAQLRKERNIMMPNPKKEMSPVTITPAANRGFLVQVGCETFIVNDNLHDISRALDKVKDYMLNPAEMTKEWYSMRNAMEAKGATGLGIAPPAYQEERERGGLNG